MLPVVALLRRERRSRTAIPAVLADKPTLMPAAQVSIPKVPFTEVASPEASAQAVADEDDEPLTLQGILRFIQQELQKPPAEIEPDDAGSDDTFSFEQITAFLLGELRSLRLTENSRRAAKMVLAVVVILLPLILLFALPVITNAPPISSYLPFWNDEIYYWRQAASFQAVGFNTGYFTYGEQIAPVGNFYAWGAFVPIFHGAVGKLLGWSLFSIPLLNAMCMSLALAALVRAMKPTFERLIWLLLALAVFAPLLMWQLPSLVEVTTLALAVLVAAAFYPLMTTRPPTRRQVAFALVAVTLATLLRPMMGVFFLPLGVLLQRRNNAVSIALGLAGGAVVGAIVVYGVMITAAPYPFNPLNDILAALSHDIAWAVQLVQKNLTDNLQYFTQAEPPQLFQRAQIVVAVALLGVTAVVGLWRYGRRLTGMSSAEALLHLFNLSSVFVFYMLFYDIRDWRDFRGEAPHVLFSVMLFVAFRRRFWLALFVASGLVFLPQVVPYYTNWSLAFLSPERHAVYEEWQPKLAQAMIYQPDAPTPWCNTVTHTGRFFDSQATLLALPPEFAISFTLDARELPMPAKARYLLVDPASFVVYEDRFKNLEPVLEVPGGMLFLNPDSACPAADEAQP